MEQDQVIAEKKAGDKASWELPADADGLAESYPSSSSDTIPSNYGNNLPTYEEPSFEVKKKSPGRLG